MAFLLALLFLACESPMQKNTDKSDRDVSIGRTVILVHGYARDSDDMKSLAKYLEKSGYRPVAVDLPLIFEHVEEAAEIFEKRVEIILSDLAENESVAMVGHSTGGLVIRYFLSHSRNFKRVSHAVLIATPNQGSRLAGLAGQASELLVETFATLDSLRPENIPKLGLCDPEETKTGAIAGNKSTLAVGRLLEKENDGRVEVKSVFYPQLDDFIVVPYNHNKIHHQKKTADLVISFLKFNSFSEIDQSKN